MILAMLTSSTTKLYKQRRVAALTPTSAVVLMTQGPPVGPVYFAATAVHLPFFHKLPEVMLDDRTVKLVLRFPILQFHEKFLHRDPLITLFKDNLS